MITDDATKRISEIAKAADGSWDIVIWANKLPDKTLYYFEHQQIVGEGLTLLDAIKDWTSLKLLPVQDSPHIQTKL